MLFFTKWELFKYDVCKFSQEFSVQKAAAKKQQITMFQTQMKQIDAQLTVSPNDLNLINQKLNYN